MRLRSFVTAIASIAISLPALAVITGTVINGDGQAIAGAKISVFKPETIDARRARLFSKTPQRTPLATTTSDSRGNFSIDSPKEPVLALTFEATGYAPEAERVLPDEEIGAIPMFPAAMQKGTVTGAGKPVVGAVVVYVGGGEYVTTTDANGRYSAPDPSKWANRLVIIHPDFAVLDETLGRFGTAKVGLDQGLDAGVTVKGRVVDADGNPVKDAPVMIDDRPIATTGADGTFVAQHAPKKWSAIDARGGDRIATRAHSTADVVMKLAKPSTIAGIVTDSKTNVPLAGVEVRLTEAQTFGPGGGRDAISSAFTDAKGAYTLTPIEPGNYQINPMRPGYVTPNVNVSVKAGQTVQKALFSIPRGRILGSVVDDQKHPVAGARIAVRPATRGQMGALIIGNGRNFGMDAPAFSGPDGRFVMRSAVTEIDVQVDAAKKGYPGGQSATLKLAPAERKAGVLITIPHGIALTGKVVDHDGKALSGVGVEAVESVNDMGMGGARRMVAQIMRDDRTDEVVRTGSDGTFTIRVKEGTYDVVFKRDGFATKSVRGEQVNATTKPLTVTLDPGVQITGRVTRAGAGIEGVMVNALSTDGIVNATTGPDGSFRLEDLTPGQLMLTATKRDEFIQQMRPVTAPAQDVTIEVPPGGRVSGHVVDKSTHNPVTSFQAGISTSRSGGGMVIQTPPILKAFTADDGSFTLENVPAGPVQIVVSAPGYTTAHLPGITVDAAKPVDNLEVDLDTGVRLTGRVTDSSGAPLSGVSVRQDTGGNGPMRMMGIMNADGNTITDPNGEYSLDTIEPGEKTFVFARQGYLTESRTINLSSSSSRLDVQLSSGVHLTGQVVTDAGSPVADALVSANSASDSSFGKQARTDANGAFQLDGLTAGHYRLTASKAGLLNGVVTDFDVAAGVPARITMKSGGTITGRVTGLTSDELQTATVFANGSTGNASAAVDSSGNFRIDGAPTGTVRISARTGQMFGAGGKSSQQQSVQIDPGSAVTVNLEFKNTTVITGHVTRDGQPMANASIAFFPKGSQASTNASAQTDGNGNYQVSGLDDASYSVQVVDFQRIAPFTTSYDVKGSGNFDIDIKSATVRGVVTDSTTGQPIVNAMVELRATGGDAILSSRAAQTASDGSFTIDSVARGNYEAKAQSDGYGHQIQNIVVGDTNQDLEFKLAPSNGITLTVVDARDNSTLAASVVRIVDGQGQNVDMGGFRFGFTPEPIKLPLSAGTYRITVTAMNYATQTFDAVSPSNPTIRLSPGGTVLIRSKSNTMLRGRILDANGVPYIRGFAGPGSTGIFTIDPSPGVTTLQNVASGSYTLQVLGSGDQVVSSVPFNVVDGQQTPVDLN